MRLIKILLDQPNGYLKFGVASYFVLLFISFIFLAFAFFGPELSRNFGNVYVLVMTFFLAISITSGAIGKKKFQESEMKR